MGVVKGVLRRSLGQAVLSWEELVTALTEVEQVINRRPITYLWESSEPGGGVSIPVLNSSCCHPVQMAKKKKEN